MYRLNCHNRKHTVSHFTPTRSKLKYLDLITWEGQSREACEENRYPKYVLKILSIAKEILQAYFIRRNP